MSVPRPSVVFSDLDGTLVNTVPANFGAYRAALDEVGFDLTDEIFRSTWGEDSRDFLPRIAPGLTASEVDGVRARKAELYPQFLHLTSLNDALVRVLRGLKPTASVVLVTTAKRESVASVLSAHGLADLFDHVVCGDDTAVSKPSPAPYLLALELCGARPEDAITFEDSDAGIASARAAGIDVVRVEFTQ